MASISARQDNFEIELIVNETSSDVMSNTSTASWQLWLRTLSGTSYMYGTPTINVRISSKEAHVSSLYRRYDNITTTGILVTDGTVTGLKHLDNGVIESNAISFDWTGSGFTPNNLHASGTYDTTIIQRRSIITATRAYVGETSQLNVTTYVPGYKHSIAYSFGSLSGYILPDGTTSQSEYIMDTSYIGFSIPTTWYNEIPNVSEANCTLSVKTYNGNLQVGTTYITMFKVLVDENNAPLITATITDDLNSTVKSITGFSPSNNVLVKGYSIPQITWSATPQNNATLSSVSINDNIVSSSPSNLLLDSDTIIIRATDSRGLTRQLSIPFTLVDYNMPTLETNAGRVDDTSLYMNVIFSGKWFNGTIGNTQNAITRIYWKYLEYGSSPSDPWTMGGNLTANTDYTIKSDGTFYSGNSTNATTIQLGPLPDYTKSYYIAIIVEDVITVGTTTACRVFDIMGGVPLINWEEDYVNVNGDIKQFNEYLIESGSNANGNYIKYSDGTMICYKSVTANVAMTTAWGNLYEGTMQLGNWAEQFISTPIIQVTNVGINGAMIECFDTAPTATSAGVVYLARTISYTADVTVNVIGIGRWRS